ncbi:MAG: hypothetical protein B7Z06_08395 [Flavobacteriales bacterium 32-35-8]|nr:MAG: hypothetical protein B7Z06_08395 [Flavobacteriales bacterium 32-35-8]
MKIIFVLIIQVALLLSIKASSQTIISGGDVSGLWNLSGSPYIVQGDIILNGELIIEPGVEVLFDEGIRFNVFGKLIAEGNKTSRIIFKNNANFWGGIHFINSSEASILKYFEVAGVRNLVGYGGAISVENSNSTYISHGTVFNNSSENRGGGISLLNLENFTISHILLYENSLYSEDGLYSLKDGTAIHIASSLVNLLNITAVKNTFSNALSGSASTIYWDSNSEVKFTNCIIQNNESTSIGRSNEYDQFNISYSNINGLEDLIGLRKLVVGEGNYDAPPSFVDYENDNFSLLWNNFPMQASKPREIDGGDPSIHNDDGSISDIGALTFDQMGEYFPPGAWFSADKNRIQAGTSVQFNNNSQKGSLDIALYYWDFGDGNFSNEIAPEHIYSDYGRFDVSLTVTDTNGNSNTQNLTDFIVSGTIILEGPVSGEWNKFLSPYIISGDIIIPQNELLDIKPDVEVLFSGYYGIKVEGDLRSIGNEEERVIFTSLDTINFWNKNLHWNYFYYERELNGWKGIEFVGNNLNSIMKFTDISYFRNFYLSCGDTNYFGGAVRLNNADGFIFDNCRFVNNNGHGYGLGSSTCYKGACIKAYSSDIIVSNCVFENNEADYSVAIYTWNSDNTKIENNIFRNNYSMGGNVTSLIDLTGEAYFEVISDNRIVVKNNIIENNEVGGISLGSLEGNVLIEGNLINNNIGHGITTSLSSPIISRNRITNNIASEGVGIYTLPSFGIPQIVNNFISGNTITYYWGQGSGILCETNTYIVNNTITNNTSTGINGEAIYGDNATYTAINNILFNNPNGDYGQNRGDSAYAIVVVV